MNEDKLKKKNKQKRRNQIVAVGALIMTIGGLVLPIIMSIMNYI